VVLEQTNPSAQGLFCESEGPQGSPSTAVPGRTQAVVPFERTTEHIKPSAQRLFPSAPGSNSQSLAGMHTGSNNSDSGSAVKASLERMIPQ
jgi:hypothetical protein